MAIWAKAALFVGGMAASTLGIKALTSKCAKKVYTHTTAAALRGKEAVMENVTKVRECCGDIAADARALNEKNAQEQAEDIIEDTYEEVTAEEETSYEV
ncbi:MAG: DUF6110 family protein [Ruminococcus sp.]|nr:DUF6110 family protein [Ruminococcus sp.]